MSYYDARSVGYANLVKVGERADFVSYVAAQVEARIAAQPEVEDPDAWIKEANCRDQETVSFSPEPPSPGNPNSEYDQQVQDAKVICKACTVIDQCAAYALEYGEKGGIWGGMTEAEREGTPEHQRTVYRAAYKEANSDKIREKDAKRRERQRAARAAGAAIDLEASA